MSKGLHFGDESTFGMIVKRAWLPLQPGFLSLSLFFFLSLLVSLSLSIYLSVC